ncbi:hypothetical protein MTR67_011125 [Solanum verrucosum]|uniref:Uncharacterized protein n=1 Tax=Solanum verrucosum TaxID=315347 RepID=A0AAF0TLN5_SOLVR|nr:hypothetical protein MTR67_011125 [Solanum verrucosum]
MRSFRDVPNSDKHNLKLYCVLFDFTDPTKDLKEKDIDCVTSAAGKFMETVVQETVKMVSLNLFRSRAPQPHENQVLEALILEEEEPLMDAACANCVL